MNQDPHCLKGASPLAEEFGLLLGSGDSGDGVEASRWLRLRALVASADIAPPPSNDERLRGEIMAAIDRIERNRARAPAAAQNAPSIAAEFFNK